MTKSGRTSQRSRADLPSSDFDLRARNTTAGANNITPEDLRSLAGAGRPKYHAKRTYVPALDRTFASKHEATVAVGLALRQELGEIRDLFFQVPYRLEVEDVLICTYVADFRFEERRPERDTSMGEAWVSVVADAKGYPTPVYRLKKKLMKAIHGIDVVEL